MSGDLPSTSRTLQKIKGGTITPHIPKILIFNADSNFLSGIPSLAFQYNFSIAPGKLWL